MSMSAAKGVVRLHITPFAGAETCLPSIEETIEIHSMNVIDSLRSMAAVWSLVALAGSAWKWLGHWAKPGRIWFSWVATSNTWPKREPISHLRRHRSRRSPPT